MSSPVSEEARRLVAQRADFLCEYCLLHEDDGFFAFQTDHIISRKHGGNSDPANLAFACPACNRRKGSDLGTISRRTGALTRFFNPRMDAWAEHFRSDLAKEALRFWHVRSFLIIYRSEKRPIEIVRVLGGARDVAAILES